MPDAARPEIGWRAPSFAVQDINDGQKVVWSSDHSQPTIFNFWASWCRAEMPYFQEAYERYGDQVQFMMVNTGDDPIAMERYLQEKSYTFPVWIDKGRAADDYRVIVLPETYVVNTEGIIVDKQMGAMSRGRFF